MRNPSSQPNSHRSPLFCGDVDARPRIPIAQGILHLSRKPVPKTNATFAMRLRMKASSFRKSQNNHDFSRPSIAAYRGGNPFPQSTNVCSVHEASLIHRRELSIRISRIFLSRMFSFAGGLISSGKSGSASKSRLITGKKLNPVGRPLFLGIQNSPVTPLF